MAGSWRWNAAQFAERKWWQNYLKNKEVRPYLAWKKDYWNALLIKCYQYFATSSFETALDAGCGPAGIFMSLETKKVHAFDPLIDSYEKDLPHFKKENYPNVTFEKVGLEDFNTSNLYDATFCMNAINHVQDINKSFDVLVHATKPGGYLIVTIDAHNFGIFKRLFRFLPGDILHPHQYDLNEYQKMLMDRNCTLLGTDLLKHEFFFDHYLLVARRNS